MPDEILTQPVGGWNKRIQVDWSTLFASIAKAGLKTASVRYDDAWAEVAGGIEALGLKEKHDGATLAWLLINTALAKSVLALLIEARKRNPKLAEATFGDRAVAFDAAALMGKEVAVSHRFLDRPEQLPFLDDVRTFLRDWFDEIGVDKAEAATLTGRLTPMLVDALQWEWRNDPAWERVHAWAYTPLTAASRRQACWERITSLTLTLPDQPVFAEAFTLRDIHVPLRAYRVDRPEARGRGRRHEPAAEADQEAKATLPRIPRVAG